MKMKSKVLMVSIMIIVFFAGCIGTSEQVEEHADDVLNGELKLDGSTTVYPIAVNAARLFMEDNPGVTIDVQQSSSGEGLTKFLAGEIDISDATRPPKESEYNLAQNKGMSLHMTIISLDAVVLIVNPDNPVTDLTNDQIKAIYFDGTITDWSELTNGAKKGKINIYNTDPKVSGTAQLFNMKITGNDETPYVAGTTQIHPTPEMVPTIINDPNGIAFTPLKWVNSNVKLLRVDGITPKADTVIDGSFPLARKMYMITDGRPEGITKEFINFILSRDGQKIVEDEGFIPII